MNIIIKTSFIIVIYVIFSSILKTYRPEYVFILRISTILFVVYFVIDYLSDFIDSFLSLFSSFEIDSLHINLLIKVVGISILTEIISDNLTDNGESALANTVILISKFMILYMSLPVLNGIIIFCLKLIEQ